MNDEHARERRLAFQLTFAFVLALFAAAALSAVAHGATLCVHTPSPCPVIGANKSSIQSALDTAAANGTEDTVLVGANGGVPYAESPTYLSAETVHVVGAGIGETVVSGDAGGAITFVLDSPTSTLEAMTIAAKPGTGTTALVLSGTAERVALTHDGVFSDNSRGAIFKGNGKLRDSVVEVDGFQGIESYEATGALVEDTTIRAGGVGVRLVNGADLDLRRVTIDAPRAGLDAGSAGTTADLENVVIRRTGTLQGDASLNILSGATVLARHLTVIDAGGAAVLVDASSASTSVVLRDSVLSGGDYALRCYGAGAFTATLSVAYSNWTKPNTTSDPECAFTNGAGNSQLAPGFAADGIRLLASSPLIDAADPADPLASDRDGLARKVDGDGDGTAIADMGAFEYQRRAPLPVLSAPPSALAGAAAAFSAAGSTDPDLGDTLSYAWDFGDGAATTGPEVSHAFAAAGAYPVTLTVTDSAGVAATATAQVQVTAPPSPAPPGATPPATPGVSTPPASKPGKARRRCVKGKHRRKVHGKVRCVRKKTRKHHPRRGHHKHAG